MKDLIAEYGWVALAVYVSTAAVVGVSAFLAVYLGFEVEGTEQRAGTLFAVWVIMKITQPFRIAITVALTPVVVHSRLNPLRRKPAGEPEDLGPEALPDHTPPPD